MSIHPTNNGSPNGTLNSIQGAIGPNHKLLDQTRLDLISQLGILTKDKDSTPTVSDDSDKEKKNSMTQLDISEARQDNSSQKSEHPIFGGNGQLNRALLANMVAQKIEGIYPIKSVTVNRVDHDFGPIKGIRDSWQICIKREFCLDDVFLTLGKAFFKAIRKGGEFYREKMINDNDIADFLLDANLTEDQLQTQFSLTKAMVMTQNPNSSDHLDRFENIVKRKYENNLAIVITEDDIQDQSETFKAGLKLFIDEFNNFYAYHLEEYKRKLRAAYWNCRSYTIIVPTQLHDFEKDERVAYIQPSTVSNVFKGITLQIDLARWIRRKIDNKK